MQNTTTAQATVAANASANISAAKYNSLVATLALAQERAKLAATPAPAPAQPVGPLAARKAALEAK
jgi:hypothetical protein